MEGQPVTIWTHTHTHTHTQYMYIHMSMMVYISMAMQQHYPITIGNITLGTDVQWPSNPLKPGCVCTYMKM